jgi:DNA polymerase III delta prime subunit
VIESIQSRLHIVKITQPTNEQIRKIMDRIIETEEINMDEESKEYLLMISSGSIRILLNYLEKMYIYKEPITISLCKKLCSNISFQKFEIYFDLLKEKKLVEAIDILYEIYDYGYSVIDILDYFFSFIKITTSIDEDTKYSIIPFICKYITVFHNIHEDGIELAVFTNNLFIEITPIIDKLENK